jgi:NAD(P)H-flavin reductase
MTTQNNEDANVSGDSDSDKKDKNNAHKNKKHKQEPQGLPTQLVRKVTLVVAASNRLPVHTLTFRIPSGTMPQHGKAQPHASVRLDMGDVVKMVIPGYKPKSYSMSRLSSTEFDITLKVYPHGRASGYLDRMSVGDFIHSFGVVKKRIRNPGTFVGIICFGVGITEGLPIAQAELNKGDADRVVLQWASRTMADTFWEESLQQMQAEQSQKFQLVHLLSRETKEGCLHGHITPSLIRQVFQPPDTSQARFVSVGTKEMMKQTYQMLLEVGYQLPQNQLFYSKEKLEKGDAALDEAVGGDTGKND